MTSEINGYWYWTWSSGKTPPTDTTMSIAFSGYSDINEAVAQSEKVKSSLVGEKYLSVGGGNDSGKFTNEILTTINQGIKNDILQGYDGIAYDIEVGDSGLEGAFALSFQTAKQMGLKVLVTVSHSAPYGISDGERLMESFFANRDIDLLSPQLYTTGEELHNDYAISDGVQWSEYAHSQPKVVPSIVQASYYPSAQEYFRLQDVQLSGYVQWKQG